MTDIVFKAAEFERLKRSLVEAAPNEAGAILLCHSHGFPVPNRILVRETLEIPSEDYETQESFRMTIKPAFIARALKQARERNLSLFFLHSHPKTEWPHFSAIDDRAEKILMPFVFGRALQGPHGSVVLGDRGFSGRVYFHKEQDEPSLISRLKVIGPQSYTEEKNLHPVTVNEIHDRNIRAFGEGQKVLQRLKIGIVGLGGVGSMVNEQMAHLGAKSLLLIDFDDVERTNLNRLVGSTLADIGATKVSVAERYARSIGTDIDIKSVCGSVLHEPIARSLLNCDLIFSCTDSHGSRAVLNQIAYQYLIPTIDIGIRIDAQDGQVSAMAGRVQMLAPDLPCLLCSNLLDPEEVRRDFLSSAERKADSYIVGHDTPQPAVMSLNGTVSSLAVTMGLAACIGFPSTARHLVYLPEQGVVRRIAGQPNPNCIVCSSKGSLARADDWEMIWQP